MLLAVGLVLVTLAGIGGALFGQWRKAQAEQASWKPGNSGSIAFTWKAEPGTDLEPAILSRQVDRAVLALLHNTAWPGAEITAALWGVRIYVHRGASWNDAWGRSVGGLASPEMKSVEVGSDLAGLAHEFAHVARWVIDHKLDDSPHDRHPGWDEAGLYRAIAEYQAT